MHMMSKVPGKLLFAKHYHFTPFCKRFNGGHGIEEFNKQVYGDPEGIQAAWFGPRADRCEREQVF